MIRLAAVPLHPGIDDVIDREIIRRAHQDGLAG
jgi:hypothetical protein